MLVTNTQERLSRIKVDIVNEVSTVADISKGKAEVAVDAVFDAMRLSMQRGERSELRGFGVFEVKQRKPRKARNPRTGDPVDVKAKFVVTFQPGMKMEEDVRVHGRLPEPK